MDALEQLHPIEVEVPQARSIGELFDSISYKMDLLSLECCRVILVQDQDIIFMLFLISSEGCEVAWRWLKFCSNEKADEIEAFFASCMHPSFTMSLKQSMEQIDSKRGGLTTKGESNLYKT
ncbi:uncharacterized protein LOC126724949 isoform X11 [Quercus robur]|uniref:uncharacterized protein LOC126724949 isoform X11 n=1 Tax=Quercus robur TaxID=38942 RepID=UPI0021623075|nr:uncharacterized protein LOC126724949 isoform X11 [Quercus robur]XP_050285350.1 uncharacterized protein LOC126724949 isoform X12 [Quercus robur]XP_050285352.1 uncharacterized protein LOC126724949 isoform X11 [Quercus robur]XP_050285353.1 uncharacterized protein LOC126724949 isoform X11 [Quercus robur]XP_050285354.1 uncharacterized protein LOC126724949 isoform X12 [Quercus robur]XP_050285355.1 uncharacterized protein LOC126724949 isoform X11 [Quercus robur]XP_050285356.1 uncharacterized prot